MMKRRSNRGMLAGLMCAGLASMLAAYFVHRADVQMQAQEQALLAEQVRRAAVSCYASEGRYPQDVEYLRDHYGLTYDEERYSVMYDAFASNVMPDISVNIRGDERQ